MLLFPYSTDAPLYHLPLATVSIIIANVVIFFATTFQLGLGNVEEEAITWLILEFDTINPVQWITGAFMHADLMHLLGNMFFLWAFGLVVEGKIGGVKFLTIYMLMAAIDGAVVQIPMFLLGSDSGALGASGVIFALMLIAMLWAPENELDCFYFFLFRAGTFEIRILTLAGIFVFLQVVSLVLSGFSMSSEMLHMVGVLIGLPFGVYMLRSDMVDCEGWDLISRNEWLQQYEFLCSDKQRHRLSRKDAENYDPVTAALATSGRTVATANASALAGSLKPRAEKPIVKKSMPKLKLGFGGKNSAPVTAPQVDYANHPEFNRLTFLLRQSIDSKSTNMAQQHYTRLDELSLLGGVSEKLLMSYVSVLANEKRWVETLRPLAVIANREGELANAARIRMAQVQWKVLKKPEAARGILQSVILPPGALSPENQKILATRDAILAEIQKS